MKENLKPYAYKQRERNVRKNKRNLVLFVERAGELRCDARLSVKDTEPKRKRI